jgi:hypothetical protein
MNYYVFYKILSSETVYYLTEFFYTMKTNVLHSLKLSVHTLYKRFQLNLTNDN